MICYRDTVSRTSLLLGNYCGISYLDSKRLYCRTPENDSGANFQRNDSDLGFKVRDSGVNKSARERVGRQNLSQKVPSKKGSLGVRFSPRKYRENAHFEGRHSGRHLLGRPPLFTSERYRPKVGVTDQKSEMQSRIRTESPRKGPRMGLRCFYRKPPLKPS